MYVLQHASTTYYWGEGLGHHGWHPRIKAMQLRIKWLLAKYCENSTHSFAPHRSKRNRQSKWMSGPGVHLSLRNLIRSPTWKLHVVSLPWNSTTNISLIVLALEKKSTQNMCDSSNLAVVIQEQFNYNSTEWLNNLHCGAVSITT